MSDYNRDNFKDGKTTKLSSFNKHNQRGIPFSGSNSLPHGIESDRFLLSYKEQVARYLPSANYRNPAEFCQYGSAEAYYGDSFDRILETYPYDGSKSEKIEWSLSSSVVDLYILEHEYPKSTGHIDFGKDHPTIGTRHSGKLYSQSSSPKYIKFFGGPHKGTIYSQSKNRESNLKIDGEKGNTVEFWLKKDQGSWRDVRNREVVLDVFSKFNDFSEYGRLLIELETPLNDTHSPIKLTHTSGAIGTTPSGLGAGIRLGDSSVTMDTIADGQWHHYAITMKTVDTSTVYKLYIDGTLNYTTTESWKIGPITHFINGAIGASGGGASPAEGEGTLQAALDEFRYWKEARTEKQIGENWYRPVHGGTDGDHSNANLGLYYKFNEGITNSTDLDKIVLDYSGRINNGTIVNYDPTMRSLDSAINLSLNLPINEKDYTEKGDPIIVDGNNLIESKKSEFLKIGKEYDLVNNNSLLNSVPQFVRDQDQVFFPELTQIIGSVLDDIFLKIKHLPKLKDYNYEDFFTSRAKSKNLTVNNFFLGCDDSEESKIPGAKTKPWTRNILEHFGFLTPEIFQEATMQEYFNQNNEDITFDQKLSEIRNIILSNIHKNLVYIYSSKGTEKSFRNMLRCFGVDTELIKFNVYVENEKREVLNDVSFETVKQKSANFSDRFNTAATIYNSSSADPDSRGFISGSNFEAAYTLESNIILPSSNLDIDIAKGSLFGLKTTDNSLDLFQQQGSGSFEVFAVRPKADKKDVYFLLTSSYHMFQEVTSSTFTDGYNNEHWNISVKVSRDSDIEGSLLPAGSSESYKVELSGFNYDLDVMQNSFTVSSSVTKANFDKFNYANKFVYAGAERAEVSGSILNKSNVRCLGLSFWLDKLTEEELRMHAQNSSYFGRKTPSEVSKYNSGQNILAGDSSIFRWQFENLSGSLDDGTLTVNDLASGSLSRATSINGGSITGYKHPARGFNFGNSSNAIEQEFMPFVKVSPIGNRYSSKDVNIINTEIEKFTADSRPSSKKFTFEKSLYQVISERMLDFFSGIVGFDTLIGSTVNKYRQEYKALKILRERFFSKVENPVDLDKFIEYYRWIDDSISQALAQLLPASANINDNLRNIVESHMLERNKYQHPAPTLEFKANEDIHPILGINELTYNWKLGHAPLPTLYLAPQDDCLWANQREEVSADRVKIKEAAITEVSGSTYARRALVKPYIFSAVTNNVQDRNLARGFYKSLNEARSIEIRASEILDRKPKCTTAPVTKSKYDVNARINSDIFSAKDIMPFSFMSESNSLLQFSSSNGMVNFDKTGLKLTNIQDRSILQGPFTNQHEGRMAHLRTNIGERISNRPEAYHISMSLHALTMSVVDTGSPRSVFTEGMGISTPYTIRNIKTSTESMYIGNYQKDYEIVQAHGKHSNNKDLLEDSINFFPSDHIDGITDYTRVTGSGQDHVIVCKFSTPDALSAAAFTRDPESGEFSVYNTLNYRNLLVRDTKDALDEEYAEQFGYRSGSSIVASSHKTNRNPNRFVTEQKNDLQYDNFFKQTHIPANDYGYSWITASANEDVYSFLQKNANFGHQDDFYPGFHLLHDSSSALYFDDGGSNNPYVRFVDDDSWTFSADVSTSVFHVGNFRLLHHNRSGPDASKGGLVIADNDVFSFVASSSATSETVAKFDSSLAFKISEDSSYKGQLTLANSGSIVTGLTAPYTYPRVADFRNQHEYISMPDAGDTNYTFAKRWNPSVFDAQYVRFPGGDTNDTSQYPTTFSGVTAEHYPFLWADDTDDLSFVNAANNAEVSFTIAFWMRKHVKSSSVDPGILGKWSSNSEYFLKQVDRSLSLQIRSSNDPAYAPAIVANYTATNILSDNTNVWEHIAITYDVTANKIKFYKNGALFTDNASGTQDRHPDFVSGAKIMQNSTNKFIVGKVTATSRYPFDGDLSNIAIFKHDGDATADRSDVVCSAADIKMLYNDGLVFDYTQHSKAADMVCWWPMAINRNSSTGQILANSGSATADLKDGRAYAGSSPASMGLNDSPFFFTTYKFNHLSASTSTTSGKYPYLTDGVLDGKDFKDDAMTIAFWLRKVSTASTSTILSKHGHFEVLISNRMILLRLINSDYDLNNPHGAYPFQGSGTRYSQHESISNFLSPSTNEWEHIIIHRYYNVGAGRFEADFYHNGIEISFAQPAAVGASTYRNMRVEFDDTPLTLGNLKTGGTDSFMGQLSNVALWNHGVNGPYFNIGAARAVYNVGRVFDLRRLNYAHEPRNLVGYFKLDRMVPSYSPRHTTLLAHDLINGTNGTINAGSTLADGVAVPELHYQHVEDRSIFMSAWIRLTSTGNPQVLVSKNEHNNGNPNTNKEYELRVDADGKLVLQLFDQTPISMPSATNESHFASLTFTGPTIPSYGTWHHIAVTYDPGVTQLEDYGNTYIGDFTAVGGYDNRATFYINNVASSPVAPTESTLDYISMINTAAELRIGHRKNLTGVDTSSRTDGYIAHLFVATGSDGTPFTSADVTEAYNDGKTSNLQSHSKFQSASYYYKFTNSDYDKGSVPKDITAFPFQPRTIGSSLIGTIGSVNATWATLKFQNLRDVNFAFSFWILKADNVGTDAIIAKFAGGTLDNPTGAPEFVLYKDGRDLKLRLYDLTQLYGNDMATLAYREATATNLFSSVIEMEEWEHITVVRDKDNDKVIFYRNGNRGGIHNGSKTEVDIGPGATSPLNRYEEMENTTNNVTIGQTFEGQPHDGTVPESFQGQMSNFLVFKQTIGQPALTETEVSEIYNSGIVYDYRDHSKASQIAAWYKFDDIDASIPTAFGEIVSPGRTAAEQISNITGSFPDFANYGTVQNGTNTRNSDGTPDMLISNSPSDQSFTITFRMKTANTSKQYFIGKVDSSSGNIEYTGFIEANKIVFKFNESDPTGSKTFTANITGLTLCNDEWRHVAIVYSATHDRMNFFINGKINVSNVTPTDGSGGAVTNYLGMRNQSSMLYIGNASNTGYNSFSGSLADFAIYKHDGLEGRSSNVFTGLQVSSSYNHGYKTDLNFHAKVDDLVGYWQLGGHLDGPLELTLTDRSIKQYGPNLGLVKFVDAIRFITAPDGSGLLTGNSFKINIPVSAGGTPGANEITVKVKGSLTAGAGTGRVNSSLPASTIELKIPNHPTTPTLADKRELRDSFIDAVNGTGPDDNAKFIVSENLISGIAGITAKQSSSGLPNGVDMQSTSRDPTARSIAITNISTGSYVQSFFVDNITRNLHSYGIQDALLQSPVGLTPDKQINIHSSRTISFLEKSEQDASFGFVPNNRVISPKITITDINGLHQGPCLNDMVFENTASLPADLNSILLSRQGPYGWPTWKQMRGSEHPVTKALRDNSLVSIVFDGQTPSAPSRTGYRYDPDPSKFVSNDSKNTDSREIFNFTEPVALQSYSPVAINFYDNREFIEEDFRGIKRGKIFFENISLIMEEGFVYNPLNLALVDEIKDYQHHHEKMWTYNATPLEFAEDKTTLSFAMIKTSYQNDLIKFSNESLNTKLKIHNVTKHNTNILIKDLVSQDGYDKPIMFSFKKSIFPRDQRLFLGSTRARTLFDYPWHSVRKQRVNFMTGSLDITEPPSQVGYYIYPKLEARTKNPTRDLNSMGIDTVGHSDKNSSLVIETKSQITSSVWPLDARTNFSSIPANLGNYFSTNTISPAGRLGEGELQNDYSIYHGGLNTFFAIAPPAMVYNRKVVQNIGYYNTSSLTGDAEWLAGSQLKSYPYKNSYDEDLNTVRSIAKDYSLVSEYKIGDHVESIILGSGDFLDVIDSDNLFSATGSIANDMISGVMKTYSTSDIMDCFGLTISEGSPNQNDIKPIKITLRCDAAIKFVPYEGFYPVERTLQMGRLFSNSYLSNLTFTSQDTSKAFGTNNAAAFEAKKRANLQQAIKPLFAPGILFNSIKAGLAVDYPIFVRNEGEIANSYHETTNPYGLLGNLSAPVNGGGPYRNSSLNRTTAKAKTNTDTLGITGSHYHFSDDTGIPRISGSLSTRITFEDLLDPSRLEEESIHDNEPHPSASLLFGNHMWESILERPFKFGQLDATRTQVHLGGNLEPNGDFATTMRPFSLAMNNFCAETVDLFINDGLTTFEASAPSTAVYTKDRDYKMRLVLENNNVMMYDRHSAFGPPVDEGGTQTFQSASYTSVDAAAIQAVTELARDLDETIVWPETGDAALATPGFDLVTNVGTQTNFSKTLQFRFYRGSLYAATGTPVPSSGNLTSFTDDSSSQTVTLYRDIEDADGLITEFNGVIMEIISTLVLWRGTTPAARLSTEGEVVGRVRKLQISQDVAGAAGNQVLTEVGAELVSLWGNLARAGNAAYTNVDGRTPMFTNGADEITNINTIVTMDQNLVLDTHGYLPYVPPFLDKGTSPYIEFCFRPNQSRTYTLEEVFDNLQVTSSNNITAVNFDGGTNLINAMQLSASIDYNSFSVYQEDLDSLDSDSQDTAKRWVIQTKWEAPVLDFSDSVATAVSIRQSNGHMETVDTDVSFWKERDQSNYYRVDNLQKGRRTHQYLTSSRGMWHQAGKIPNSFQAYNMRLQDVPGYESLGAKVKLLQQSERFTALKPVSVLKKRRALKTVSEAVVAIPHYIEGVGSNSGVKFFDIDLETLRLAREHNENLEANRRNQRGGMGYEQYFNDPGSTPVESVAYQLRMLDKYVFPPLYDVNRFTTENVRLPFMFIFQFNAKFNRKDLSNIWQNVMPESRDSGATGRFSYSLDDNGETRKDTKYVSMYLDNGFNMPFDASLANKFIEEDVRWIVFKAKMRAKSSMAELKEESLPANNGTNLVDSSFRIGAEEFRNISEQGTFNWPYDYFSIVELIKVGAKADFKKG